MSVGGRIKRLREARGMTQQELARAISPDSTRQRVSNVERGAGGLSADALAKVADALGCSVDFLLGREKG